MKAIAWLGAVLFLIVTIALVVIAHGQILEEDAQEYALLFYVPAMVVGAIDLVFWLLIIF